MRESVPEMDESEINVITTKQSRNGMITDPACKFEIAYSVESSQINRANKSCGKHQSLTTDFLKGIPGVFVSPWFKTGFKICLV